MLRFKVFDRDNRGRFLENALTVVWDCDLDVPADSLSITCPYNREIRKNAKGIEAYADDRLVFKGMLDSIVTVKRAGGVILKLSARSLAAGMLDNEAEPLTYSAPAASLIFKKHILPFDISLAAYDNTPYYDTLKIDKGMSHWQVVQSFCRGRYNTDPRISGDGVAYLKGIEPEGETVFSDNSGGVVYYSLKESTRRHRIISEIKLKFRQTNAYNSTIKNPNPEATMTRRVRYVNAAADRRNLSTAEKMIANSNRDSYALYLNCTGCRTELLGQRAVVNDSVLGKIEGLMVKKVRYTADENGGNSAVTLVKEDFNVAD